jgi:hypothetical protein
MRSAAANVTVTARATLMRRCGNDGVITMGAGGPPGAVGASTSSGVDVPDPGGEVAEVDSTMVDTLPPGRGTVIVRLDELT